MLHKLSEQLAEKMITAGIVESEKRRILAYGLEVTLSSVGSILLLVALSVCLGVPTAWIGFFFGLAPLRMTAGGYHAKTQARCYLLFSALYVMILLLSQTIQYASWFYLAASGVALLLVALEAPIEAHNKPLPSAKRIRNRKLALGLTVTDTVGAVVLCLARWDAVFVRMYYWGIIAAFILMVAALIEKKEKEVILS